jgi:hypothetical protein
MAELKIQKEMSKLETLRAQRKRDLSGVYSGLDQRTNDLLGARNKEQARTTAQSHRAKLDEGLSHFQSYRQDIATLSAGLQENLELYVEFANKFENYQGKEKVVKVIGMKGLANKWRHQRISTQSPKENLQQIVDYGMQLVRELEDVREEAINQYESLQGSVDMITVKLKDYQPLEAELKERLDAMKAIYDEKNGKFKNASPTEQVTLADEMNNLHKQLTTIQDEYDTALTVYSQAQQALQSNIESRDAFDQMQRDLGRQANMIQEKLENVVKIYEAAPEALKVMMKTKGTETLDKSINYATSESVRTIIKAASGVNDATLAREEIQLVDAAVVREFMDETTRRKNDFEARYLGIREKALESQAERYAAK